MHVMSTGFVQICDRSVWESLVDHFDSELTNMTEIEQLDDFLESVSRYNSTDVVEHYKAELEYDKAKEHLALGNEQAIQYYRD